MVSTVASAEDEDTATEVVLSADFEDGLDGFTARMNAGQSVQVEVVNDGTAHGGNGYLLCTGREKSWQGATISVDSLTQGKKYSVNAWVKTPWYATVTLSMQYTDSSGTTCYSNIQSVVSQGDWVEISDAKVQIPLNATDVSLYFECSDTNVNIAVDDFAVSSTPEYKIQEDIPSLKDVYSPYFKFGGALMASELGSQSTQDLVKKHYNSITLGNELKPENVLVQSECQALAASGDETNVAVSIDAARSLLDFCRDNNISVRGHVLVWHSQTPDWFFKEGYSDDGDYVSQEVMLGRMENYIKNLMELLATDYSDVDFYAWDVVNEIWTNDGTPREARELNYTDSDTSAWVKIFGDNSFVDYAFEYAREYAPEGCKLYYNDFNEYMPDKTQAIVDMVTRLKEKGIIDGIGMQSHLDVSFPSISTYEKALKAFCETGLDVQITELDVTTSDTSEAGLETQAQYYSDIMDLAVKYSDSISAVIIWGTTDDQSWRSSRLPVLFNEDYTAKPCYYSIIDGLTDDTDTTDATTDPTVTEATEDTSATEPSETTTETSESTTDTSESTSDTEDTDDTTTPTGSTGILGDTDDSGEVNAVDVLTLKKYLLTMIDETQLDLTNADMDSSGNVDVVDLLLLKKVILGINS
jgi:endo-1,4-beta-xylanase